MAPTLHGRHRQLELPPSPVRALVVAFGSDAQTSARRRWAPAAAAAAAGRQPGGPISQAIDGCSQQPCGCVREPCRRRRRLLLPLLVQLYRYCIPLPTLSNGNVYGNCHSFNCRSYMQGYSQYLRSVFQLPVSLRYILLDLVQLNTAAARC